MSREPVGNRVRFEVFKRDKFQCQYCGRAAPEIVLNCDHIKPVADGGSSDLLNLITSCFECNNGKGAVPLEDSSALAKQHAMLAELEERRQQLEMLVLWRNELQSLQMDSVEVIADRIAARSGFRPNESGKADIRRWLRRFSIAELLAAVDDSMDSYLRFKDDKATLQSWSTAFAKIPNAAGILRDSAERPYLRRLLYIQGIIRNRAEAPRYTCLEYLEHLHLCGADLDDMERRAKRMNSLADFEGPYDEWLAKLGRPY